MQVKNVGVFCALIILSACTAATYHVNVNSLTAEGLTGGKTYLILPGNSNTPPDDLQFREFSAYVGKVLDGQGYTRAAGAEDADMAVFLSYGVGNPKDFGFSYSFPSGNSRGRPAGIKTYKPSYGVKGYETYSGRYMTHFRFIFLDAYDLRQSLQTGEAVGLWETSITSGGSNEDLRFAFPILLAAAKGYMGVGSGRTIEVILDAEDARVMDIKLDKRADPEANWREEIRARLDKKNKS